MVVYDEPGPNGENVTVRLTEAEAIAWAKEAAAATGYQYASDEDALEDFMVVHWARKEPA